MMKKEPTRSTVKALVNRRGHLSLLAQTCIQYAAVGALNRGV
ncbi:MAG: hypothetical protein ACFE8F_08150 [Promethearchaeota archaeon]